MRKKDNFMYVCQELSDQNDEEWRPVQILTAQGHVSTP